MDGTKKALTYFFATRYHILSTDSQSKACPMCNGLIKTRNTIGSFNMNNVANFSNSPAKSNHEDHTTGLISPNSVVASTSAGNKWRRYIRHPCPSPGEWQFLESPSSATSPTRSYLLQHLLFQFYIYGISQDDMDMKFNWWLNCSTPSLMILTSTVEKFKSKHRGIEHRGLQEMPFWRTSIYMNKVVSC